MKQFIESTEQTIDQVHSVCLCVKIGEINSDIIIAESDKDNILNPDAKTYFLVLVSFNPNHLETDKSLNNLMTRYIVTDLYGWENILDVNVYDDLLPRQSRGLPNYIISPNATKDWNPFYLTIVDKRMIAEHAEKIYDRINTQ